MKYLIALVAGLAISAPNTLEVRVDHQQTHAVLTGRECVDLQQWVGADTPELRLMLTDLFPAICFTEKYSLNCGTVCFGF